MSSILARAEYIEVDTMERKGLELAIGKDLSEKLLIGCQVHYGRSYQRVADRVNNLLPRQIHQISRAAIYKVVRAIPHQKEKSEVMKLFKVLWTSACYT